MFNRKRVFVFAVFILLMFFMMTFAGSANRDNTPTRTVEFVDGFDKSVLSNQIIKLGEEAQVPTTPQHDECNFVGWFIEGDESRKIEDFSNILDNMTVMSICEDIYFDVTFYDTIDNENLKVEQVRYGEDATAPSTRTHAGYTFGGWNRGYSNVTSDITVNAVYSQNPVAATMYTVTFVDGDTNETIATQSVRSGLSATLPVVPEHQNRLFDYWEGDYTNVTSNRVVTAIYKNADVYSVRFLNGSHGFLNTDKLEVAYSVFDNNTFKEGNVVAPVVNPELGYHFTGWDYDFNDDTVVTEDIVITAKYELNTDVSYKVRYEYENGKEAAPEELVENKTFNETYEETAKEITGYTPDATKKSIKLDAYDKTLVFVYSANKDVSYTVKYQTTDGKDLADSVLVENKTFNETYEETAKEITGYTPDETKKSIKLDAYDKTLVFIYNANKDVSYMVRYELKDGTKIAADTIVDDQIFGSTITQKPLDITGYTPDATSKKMVLDAYDKEMVFIYTPNKNVSYTVKYQTKDGKDLADSVLVENKTFNGTYEEKAKDITGYTPDSAKKSITLDAYNKELIFVYTAKEDVSYTVKYQTKDGKDLADSVLVENKTFDETYEETAKDITGYTPDSAKKSITLDAYNKELIFVYTANTNVSYTVKYQTKDGKDLADSVLVENKTFNETYEETAKDITGYTPDAVKKSIKLDKYNKELVFVYTAKEDASYTVKYQTKDGKDLADSVLVENKTFNETYEETAKDITGYTVDATKKSIKLDKYGKELIFVYTANTNVSYTVKYQTKDGKDLADSVLVENKTFNETYEETAKDITGYTPDAVKKSIKLDKYGKELIFVYTAKKDVSYTVKYQTKDGKDLADSVLVENKTFNETYEETAKDITGYTPDAAKKSIKLDKYGKDLIFVYTAKKDVSYTVKYQTANGKDLADSVLVENKTFNETYEETAKDIIGYTPDSAKKSIKLDKYGKELIFVYTANTNVSYTVKYQTKDGKDLADSVLVENKTFNETYEETAKDITGYTVDAAKKSIKLDKYGKELIFVYTIKNDYSYKVYYKYAGTDTNVFDPKTVNDVTYNTKVTEKALSKDGYTVDKATQELTVDAEGLSITFNYTIRNDYSYKVYYKYAGTDTNVFDPKTVNDITYNTKVTETAPSKDGYTADKTTKELTVDAEGLSITFTYSIRKDYSYKVYYKYTDGKEAHPTKSVSGQTYNTTHVEKAVEVTGYTPDKNTQSIVLDTNNKSITFTYSIRNDYSYKVYYKYAGTDTNVFDPKTVNDVTYNTKVTEKALSKDGYTVDKATQELTINAEGLSITFNYTIRNDYSYKVYYKYAGTDTNVFDPKTVNDVTYNTKVTETAPSKDGYTADKTTKELTVDAEGLSITFTYSIRKDYSYKVYYKYTDGKEAHPTKSVSGQTYNTTHVETAAKVTGYTPDKNTQSIVLDTNNKSITFTYTVNYYSLTINYFYPDGKTKIHDSYVDSHIAYDAEFSVESPNIPGYIPGNETISGKMGAGNRTIDVIYNGDPNTAYKIEHYKVVGSTATLIGQVENKKAATESTVKITDYKAPKGYKLDSNYTGTKLSGVVTADGKLVLKAYYVVDQFDYKVERYFLNETTNKYEKDTANYPDITQSADYGTVINYAATVIPGYSKPTVNPTSLTVSEVENNNIIKVYYVLGTPNIVFDIKANITRDGSPVDGTARYNDIITYTLKLTNSGDANGNINVKDLLFALAKTNGDVQITEYLGSTTEADINNLLSENGLDLVVEYGTDKEVVISFKAKVVAKPGTVIESQVIYGPEETDKLDLKRFEVESTVEIEANRESGANIALILDLSNSMNQGTKLQDMKTSATNFINKVLPASGKNPYTRICLIFMPMKNGSTTATEQKCSNNASELISEINKLNENNVTGWTPYKSGLKTAAQSINNMINKGEDCRRWRFTETCSSYPYKYNSSHVVFFTDGLPVTSRDYYDRIIIDNDYIKQAGYIRNNATLYTIGFELDDTAYNRLTAIASSGNSYRASSSTINSVFDKIYNKIKDKVTKDTQSGKVTIISNNIDKTKNVTFTVNGVDEVLSYNNAVSKGYLDESSTPIKVVASKFAAGSTIKFSYYETKIAAKEITIDNGWSSGATSGVSGYNLQNEDELEVSGTAENFKLGSDANISSSLVSPSMITEEPQTNNDNTGNEEVTNNVTSEPVVNSATEPQEENTPENNQPTQNNVVDNSTNNVSDVKPEEDRLESNDTVATEDNNTPNENNIDNNETINDDSIVNENPTNDEEGNTPNEDAPVVKDEIITIKEEVKVEVKSVEVEEEKEPEEENTNEPKEDTLNEVPTVE